MELTKGVFVFHMAAMSRADMVHNLTFSIMRMSDTCMLLLVTAILPAERGEGVELTNHITHCWFTPVDELYSTQPTLWGKFVVSL